VDVKLCFCLLALLSLAACSGPPRPLVVKQYLLRDQKRVTDEEGMVGMEKSRRLLGAVSMAERKERLGQYYTIIWNDAAGVGTGDVKIVFEYQQGATASKIKSMTKSFPASQKSGKVEFSVIGSNFFKNGKVLTWKSTLMRGQKEVAHRQSYLWQ
jgi:uncharacterized protein YcfL